MLGICAWQAEIVTMHGVKGFSIVFGSILREPNLQPKFVLVSSRVEGIYKGCRARPQEYIRDQESQFPRPIALHFRNSYYSEISTMSTISKMSKMALFHSRHKFKVHLVQMFLAVVIIALSAARIFLSGQKTRTRASTMGLGMVRVNHAMQGGTYKSSI